MSLLSIDKTLPLSEQEDDLLKRQEQFDSTSMMGGGSVDQGTPGVSIQKTLPSKRTSAKIDPMFSKWVEKNLGSQYVGPYYSTLQEAIDSSSSKSLGSGLQYGTVKGGMSLRQRELMQQGLIEPGGKWNQDAVANKYKQELAAEAASKLSAARREAVNKVMGTLPTPTSPGINAGNTTPQMSPTNKAAYWKEYYDLPPEARNQLQPGVKKAYYDIMDKALKSAGL